MKNVSKQIFLNALTCPALGWISRVGNNGRNGLSLGEMFRIEQGTEVGRRARALYPGGLLTSSNMTIAIKETRTALDDDTVSLIFEGAFVIEGLAARADVLRRTDQGWHLIEVKSATSDKDEFIDDMAYTAMVIGRCGLGVSRVSLLLISHEYRLGMPDEMLFREVDHTEEVLGRVGELETLWQGIEEITRAPVMPEPRLIHECRRCEFFAECVGRGIDNHVFNLPRLTQRRFEELAALGVHRIEDIPQEFPLTEHQSRVVECVLKNEQFISERLRGDLAGISWPAYYLDFETVMTAVPLYPETAPYAQVPTQYSIHRCSDVGVIAEHYEYLADPARDCREELARRLIDDLGEEGSIIAYSNFEKVTINSLARLFPAFAEKLLLLTDRIVDLEAIIRRDYYCPDFCGSTSIKRTLPVLVPEMTYDGLDIREGDSALAAFAYMALGKDPDPDGTSKKLLEYCKMDTLAMVRLHQRLVELVQ